MPTKEQVFAAAREIPVNSQFAVYQEQGDYFRCYRRVQLGQHTFLFNENNNPCVIAIDIHAVGKNLPDLILWNTEVRRINENGRILYTDEEEAEKQRKEELQEKVGEEIKADLEKAGLLFDVPAVLSVSGMEERNILREVAIKGKCILTAKGEWSGFFDDDDDEDFVGKDYFSPILENPTWLDVYRCAIDMVKTTKDLHHCFLEGVVATGRYQNGIPVYNFSMGS